MTHEQHLSVAKGFHLKAAEHHRRISTLHKSIGKCHEIGNPALAKLHGELSECHKAYADHHLERAACFEGVTEKVSEGDEISRLAKLLG